MTIHPPASTPPTALLSAEVVRLMRASRMRSKAQIHAGHPTASSGPATMLLFHLCKDGPQRSSALAAAACVDPSTVSRQVADLVDLGLVERRADPHDGRATLLAATDRGRGPPPPAARAPGPGVRPDARRLVRRRREHPGRPAAPAQRHRRRRAAPRSLDRATCPDRRPPATQEHGMTHPLPPPRAGAELSHRQILTILVRADDGHVPRRARPDHRRHVDPHHRRRPARAVACRPGRPRPT